MFGFNKKVKESVNPEAQATREEALATLAAHLSKEVLASDLGALSDDEFAAILSAAEEAKVEADIKAEEAPKASKPKAKTKGKKATKDQTAVKNKADKKRNESKAKRFKAGKGGIKQDTVDFMCNGEAPGFEEGRVKTMTVEMAKAMKEKGLGDIVD